MDWAVVLIVFWICSYATVSKVAVLAEREDQVLFAIMWHTLYFFWLRLDSVNAKMWAFVTGSQWCDALWYSSHHFHLSLCLASIKWIWKSIIEIWFLYVLVWWMELCVMSHATHGIWWLNQSSMSFGGRGVGKGRELYYKIMKLKTNNHMRLGQYFGGI